MKHTHFKEEEKLKILFLMKVKVKSLSHVRLFETTCTAAYQALPSMGFSRQEYWSGVPFPSPGDLPNPGIEPGSPALQAEALPSGLPGKPQIMKKKNWRPLLSPELTDVLCRSSRVLLYYPQDKAPTSDLQGI